MSHQAKFDHTGSRFDDFLEAEGIREEVAAAGCPIQGLLLALSGDFPSRNRTVAVTNETPAQASFERGTRLTRATRRACGPLA